MNGGTGMASALADSEGAIRLGIFAGLFVVLALTEWARPRRPLVAPRGARWTTNWLIVALDSLLVRILFPAAAVGVALWAEAANFGLFNVLGVDPPVAGILSFLALDLAVWASHVASHKVPLFWRVHRMHHTDRDLDVTTAIRFHPIEIIASMVWKVAVVALLGAPAVAVIVFEIALNGGAMFNHANLKLPPGLDRILRLFIVTPDMHRVHHSVRPSETDSNYGFCLPWWDRLFGTYIAQPRDGHEAMAIGLAEWQDERPDKIGWSLTLPFRR